MNVFIIDNENFNYDFLIGLDIIENFKLIQTEDLRIIQKRENVNIPELSGDMKKERKICEKYVNIPSLSGDMEKKTDNSNTTMCDANENEKKMKIPKYLNYTEEEYEINFNENINTDEFEMIINHLDIYQQSEIDKLTNRYKSVFAKDKYDVGTVKDYEARIDLIEEKYFYKRPYRCTFDDRREIENQIAKLLEKGLIEESYSPFAAPVTLAFKKDENGKTRHV